MNTVVVLGAPVEKEMVYVRLTKRIIALFKKLQLEDVVVFYPADLMKWDLGKEIVVQVSGSTLPILECYDLVEAVGKLVEETFTPSKVSCSIVLDGGAAWTNYDQERRR